MCPVYRSAPGRSSGPTHLNSFSESPQRRPGPQQAHGRDAEPEPPRDPNGKDFFHSVLRFKDGAATKHPIKTWQRRELKVVAEKQAEVAAEKDDSTQPNYFSI